MAKGSATMAKDYYATLGVDRGASDKDIRKAYRRLARETHPDVNRDDPNAEQRFKDIQRAYSVLSDPEQRKRYDQFGADFEQFQGAGPGGGFRFDGQNVDLGDLGDLFGGLFGRRGRGPGRAQAGEGWFGNMGGFESHGQPGADAEVTVQVTLDEVEQGTKRDLAVTVQDAGGGARTERLKGLVIPAGVADGDVIRVRGKGGKGRGAADGDLLVRVEVREHPFFSRKGDDLECEVPISVAEAALGGEIQVPTFRGTRPLRLPAGTQGGQRFRIKGYGVPNRKSGERGNLLVKVRVQVPTDLNPREREAFESAAERAGDPRRDLWRPRGS